MVIPEIRQAQHTDHDLVLNTITLAFSADPFNRWYLQNAEQYLKYFPRIVAAFLPSSIEAGTCFMTASGEGAAIWLPPDVTGYEEAAEQAFSEAVPRELSESFGQLLQAFEQHHPHDDDCWYLPIIGVDPAHQGKGFGGALMKHSNAILDEKNALGYLEASSEANAALYARHGFETIAELQFGTSPVARPMIRARSN